MNKENEINIDINKCYYKEENSFLDFDEFSEINKSSTSLKNIDKKEDKKEITLEKEDKKEIVDKILNKSIQKNQENFDDICNIRYLDDEDNKININNKDKDNEKDIEKEKQNEVALLNVEVNLDENNNTDKIIIYPGDDVKEKTIQFCMKHKLSEEKKNTLLHIITEKIEETKNGEGNIIRQNYVEKSLQNKEFDDIEVENEENNVNQDNIENVEN